MKTPLVLKEATHHIREACAKGARMDVAVSNSNVEPFRLKAGNPPATQTVAIRSTL